MIGASAPVNSTRRASPCGSGACDLFPDRILSDEPEAEVRLLATVRDDAERCQILAVLERTGGQVKKAAGPLGVSRTTLWEKMRRLGVKSDEQPDGVGES